MKRLLSIIVCCSILLSSCATSSSSSSQVVSNSESTTSAITQVMTESTTGVAYQATMVDYDSSYSDPDAANGFTSVRDDDLLTYMEDVVYYDLIKELDSSDYYVEGVRAVYVSQEYIEELSYNSQENLYFGYHLSDIKEAFGDTPWFFTVDENGHTIVKEYQYKEFEFEFNRLIKDIAIGAGVILVCATVSLVTAPTLPAVSMISMVAAKTGAKFALSSGALAAVSGGLVTFATTGDLNQSLQAAMDSGGEGFKIGAIMGAISGGASEVTFLKNATSSKYLTMNEAAMIQRETNFPPEVISQIHNMKEYEVLKSANLKSAMIGNKTALISTDIDWKTKIDGKTNMERLLEGKAPIDPITKAEYELHHIGQEADGTLALMSKEMHRKNTKILHSFKTESEVDHGNAWKKQKMEFYRYLYNYLTKSGV